MVYNNAAKPIRIKILVSNQANILEDNYNKFAESHDIVASQYRILPNIFSMSIWYKWDQTQESYDDVKDDPKIMDGE